MTTSDERQMNLISKFAVFRGVREEDLHMSGVKFTPSVNEVSIQSRFGVVPIQPISMLAKYLRGVR
jgi:hypothetical protein